MHIPQEKNHVIIYNIFFIFFKILQFLYPRNKYACVHSRCILLHEEILGGHLKIIYWIVRLDRPNKIIYYSYRDLSLSLSLFLR